VEDARVELFDNGGPNHLHAEPTIEAVRRGKHVLCEKPLGRTADEAFEIWAAAARAGVVHMCGFNYRFVPAIRLAREMLEAEELGEVYHFRSRFLNRSAIVREAHGAGEWRFRRETSGSGAVGDIGSHHIDLARYLVGEPVGVSAVTQTIGRPGDAAVDVDDAFSAIVEFDTGASGTIECSRVAGGHQNQNAIEVEGARGSLSFDIQDLNVLHVSDGTRSSRVSVTEPHHPFMEFWWPTPHPLGWGASFIHEFHHLLSAIGNGMPVAPHGASFEDGYRCAEVCDAILRSAAHGRREAIEYRSDGG
jgi:predicted dehydrogenase